MKKNLILMSALFAGAMFMNDGFGSNILQNDQNNNKQELIETPTAFNSASEVKEALMCYINGKTDTIKYTDEARLQNVLHNTHNDDLDELGLFIATVAEECFKNKDVEMYDICNEISCTIFNSTINHTNNHSTKHKFKHTWKKIRKSFLNFKVIGATTTLVLSPYIAKRLALSL